MSRPFTFIPTAWLLQVFTESEVRASLVFQLSKLSSLLLKSTRIVTGSGAWDALVAGQLPPDAQHQLEISPRRPGVSFANLAQ